MYGSCRLVKTAKTKMSKYDEYNRDSKRNKDHANKASYRKNSDRKKTYEDEEMVMSR